MEKKLSFIRGLQKKAMAAADSLQADASEVFGKLRRDLKKLDDQHDITVNVKKTGEAIGELSTSVDRGLGITDKAREARAWVSDAASTVNDAVSKAAEESGFNSGAREVREILETHVSKPGIDFIHASGVDQAVSKASDALEQSYGIARKTIKPYFSPDSARHLLISLRDELTYISACIMHISTGEARNLAGQFSAAIASKITGVAASATLLTLVGTFGTAGTGTAIAGLSGAAASNATLAWVGSLLGGGMATGAVLTGGLTLIVSLSAYKLLRSERRPFDTLSAVEQRIVQTCWFLAAQIDDLLANGNSALNSSVASALLNNTLRPLYEQLEKHSVEICTHLDGKNAVAFRQHVLIDFQRVVIDGFEHFIASNDDTVGNVSLRKQARQTEAIIGGAIYALLTRTAVDGGIESQMVLDALRRSDAHLAGASEAQLSNYLSHFNAEQLRGVANNVKGIYHEELWVRKYNESHTDTYAEQFRETNHPGADVQIKDIKTHQVVDEIQLKATDSVSYVNEHIERYPDIEVQVTKETANRMDGIYSSDIDNADITASTNRDIDALANNSLSDRAFHSAELSAAFGSGHGLIEMLNGKKDFPQAVLDVAKRAGSAGAATFIAAYLFS